MPQVRVVVDERERPSGVPDTLRSLGARVEYRMLYVGDYLISQSSAIERKSLTDLVSSLYDGRLFEQAEELAEAYKEPILIVEGDLLKLEELVSNQRAVWGALSTLSLSYGIHIFNTATQSQTADLILTIARRMAKAKPARPIVSPRKVDAIRSLSRAQIYTAACLPGVGPRLAERLLRRFKTLKAAFSATVAEYSTVKGIGRVKAERIVGFLEEAYEPSYGRRQVQLGYERF